MEKVEVVKVVKEVKEVEVKLKDSSADEINNAIMNLGSKERIDLLRDLIHRLDMD